MLVLLLKSWTLPRPRRGGGLYLERAKAEKKTVACLAKVSLATVASVAGTTGEKSRVDDRAVVTRALPKLLPFGGYPVYDTG
jgi:hypothetical protein